MAPRATGTTRAATRSGTATAGTRASGKRLQESAGNARAKSKNIKPARAGSRKARAGASAAVD